MTKEFDDLKEEDILAVKDDLDKTYGNTNWARAKHMLVQGYRKQSEEGTPNLVISLSDGEFLGQCIEYKEALWNAGVPIFKGEEMMSPKDSVEWLAKRGETFRLAINDVCEGWTLPAGARKILEQALWHSED